MITALSKQLGHLKKTKPAINEPPSAAAQQVQQISHQIRKELTDIEKDLKSLKKHEEPWANGNSEILWSLLKKSYETEEKVVPMIGDLLVKHNFFDVVVKIWDHCHSTENMGEGYLISPTYKLMKTICWNFSDACVNFCQEAFRHKLVFERFMRELTLPELGVEELDDDIKRFHVEATLGFLHNTLRLHHPNRELVRQNDGIQRLLSYYDSKHNIIKAKVMIVLAYCVNEEENDKIVTGKGVINFLMQILKNALEQPDHKSSASRGTFSASEIVRGFNKLALNENNKVSIVEEGILSLLTDMLTGSKFPDEQALAAKCLWSLSFHLKNKQRLEKEPGLMDAVHRLLNDPKSDEDTRKSCDGILFNLEGKNVSDLPPSALATNYTKKQHVMISYQWDVKPIILKVRDILKDSGFNVWLDVDNMKGSILSAMADAVENSSVVVICVTERYKNSNSCRTEAEYTYKLRKPIAPLLLEPHYKADGWLGALLGMQRYIKISSEDAVNAKVDAIVKMIRLKVAGDDIFKSEIVEKVAPLSAAPSDTVVDGPTSSKSFKKWSTKDVSKWAEETGIDGLPLILASFDGVALNQLLRLLKRSPDIYQNSLRVDMKLSLLQSLQFTHFLEEL